MNKDEISKRLKREKNPLQRFYLLIDLCNQMRTENLANQVFPYLNEAKKSINQLKIKYFDDSKFKLYTANYQIETAYYHFFIHYKPEIAIAEASQALAYYDANQCHPLRVNTCILLGIFYRDLNQLDISMDYYQKALTISTTNHLDEYNLISLYNEIGNHHTFRKNFDLSQEYHQKALKIASKRDDSYFFEFIYNDMGVSYVLQEKYAEAIEYFSKSLSLIKTNDARAIVVGKCNISSCYIGIGQPEKALEIQLSLQKEFALIENPSLAQLHHETISAVYQELKQFEKAYEHYQSAIECYHSIFTRQTMDKLSNLQAVYNVEHKEKEAEIFRLRNVDLAESNEKLVLHQEHLKLINQILRHDLINHISASLSAFKLYQTEQTEEMLDISAHKVEKSIELIQRMRDLEEFMLQRQDLAMFELKKVLQNVIQNHPQLQITIIGNAKVLADDAIYSVFDNVIGNASIHGKATKICVTITDKSKYCQIEVADNGIGIPREIKDDVFQEFYKYGENAQTGLGLYIVQKSIKRYGGNVYIVDNKPQGAVFVLILKQV